jgi:hypothetical protein
MSGLSRRTFLTRGSLGVAAAGVLGAVPGLPALVTAGSEDASVAEEELPAAAGELTEPLVAHVRNVSTGEIRLYLGENQVTYHDPALAARLTRAAR